MGALGIGENTDEFHQLIDKYSEKHRYYHTKEHINYCLKLFDQLTNEIAQPLIVELAIWYHDAIYNPLAKDNEKRSAILARDFLSRNGVTPEISDTVYEHILATAGHDKTEQRDRNLLIDIDLSILGDRPDVYQQFETSVRSEYKLIPAFIYKKKRKDVLNQFLTQDRLYYSETLYRERELQAKANLRHAINKLNA